MTTAQMRVASGATCDDINTRHAAEEDEDNLSEIFERDRSAPLELSSPSDFLDLQERSSQSSAAPQTLPQHAPRSSWAGSLEPTTSSTNSSSSPHWPQDGSGRQRPLDDSSGQSLRQSPDHDRHQQQQQPNHHSSFVVQHPADRLVPIKYVTNHHGHALDAAHHTSLIQRQEPLRPVRLNDHLHLHQRPARALQEPLQSSNPVFIQGREHMNQLITSPLSALDNEVFHDPRALPPQPIMAERQAFRPQQQQTQPCQALCESVGRLSQVMLESIVTDENGLKVQRVVTAWKVHAGHDFQVELPLRDLGSQGSAYDRRFPKIEGQFKLYWLFLQALKKERGTDNYPQTQLVINPLMDQSVQQRHFAYVLDCTVNCSLAEDAECPKNNLDSHHFWLQAVGDVQTVNLTLPTQQQSVCLSCVCLKTGRMRPHGKVLQALLSITFEPSVPGILALFGHHPSKRFLTWLTYVDVHGEDAPKNGKRTKR